MTHRIAKRWKAISLLGSDAKGSGETATLFALLDCVTVTCFNRKNSMSDVFILGAGFSKAISEKMPILIELGPQVVAEYEEYKEGKDPIPHFVKAILLEDFEKGLTYLAQHKPWLSESGNLRHRALYLDLTNVLRLMFKNKCEPSAVQQTSPCPEFPTSFLFTR